MHPFRAPLGSRDGLEEHPAVVDAVGLERQEGLGLLVVHVLEHDEVGLASGAEPDMSGRSTVPDGKRMEKRRGMSAHFRRRVLAVHALMR